MAFAHDKSPSESSPIPPAMLRSRCAIRMSFRLLPINPTSADILDFRYTEWHAGMHHDHTPHQCEYSLEMDTKTVSNFAGQCFVVHRLIRSSSDGGKVVEISGHCPHGENSRGCNCIKDTNFMIAILNSRSEVVVNYLNEYVKLQKESGCETDGEQKAAVREMLEDEREMLEDEKSLLDTLRRISDSQRRISDSQRRISDSDRRISGSDRRIAGSMRRISDSDRRISDSMRRISDSDRRISDSQKRISDSDRRISDSQKRISDSQRRIEASMIRLSEKESLLSETRQRYAAMLCRKKKTQGAAAEHMTFKADP